MITKWRHLLLPVVMTTWVMAHLSEASPCDGSPETLIVDHTSRKIFSPGYPNHYDNNLHCDWILQKQETEFGIQLVTLELELDPAYAVKTGECKDSLEVFEGTPSNKGLSLGKWCGNMTKIIKTMANEVTLRFLTNRYYIGKGFVIEYSLVRVASAECRQGEATPIHVGRASLYESFDVKNVLDRCNWTIEAIDEFGNSDPNSTLVIEAFSAPDVACDDGYFLLFDGQETSSLELLKFCSQRQAFSKIYLSSNYATLTFISMPGRNLTSSTSGILLKLYTRDLFYACNETHFPSITVGMHPVYFSLPFSNSLSGGLCNVHISERGRSTIRIEVMSVRGQEMTCETDAINVKRAQFNVVVKRSCNRHHPVYLPRRNDVIVAIRNATSRVYLKAISDDVFCGGEDIKSRALDDKIKSETLPRNQDTGDVPHSCYHRHLIVTDKKYQAVSLFLEWHPNESQMSVYSETDVCDADFISVYNGDNETAPLLFSSCRKADMPLNFVRKRIIGTEEKMLILYNTDDVYTARMAIIEYYAIPANGDICKDINNITVNGSMQIITSPNYPDFFPLDYTCIYSLSADVGEVIVVEAVDTQFTAGCGDIINVYDGSLPWNLEDIFGRICGHDKTNKMFVSKGHTAIIQFRSDTFGSSGGWKLKVYSTSWGDKAYGSLVVTALGLNLWWYCFAVMARETAK